MHPAQEAVLSYTNLLCQRDPQAKAIRLMLMRMERAAHAQGWDSANPWIFHVKAALDTPEVNYIWAEVYTEFLGKLCDANGGRVGEALHQLGEFSEQFHAFAKDGTLPEKWKSSGNIDELVEEARERISPDLRDRARYGIDMSGPFDIEGTVWRTFGFGVLSEAHYAGDDGDQRWKLARQHRLSEVPSVRDARSILLVTRDGLLWTLERIRGEHPYVLAHKPEGDLEYKGLLVNGLSRLLASTVGNPVAIRDEGSRA